MVGHSAGKYFQTFLCICQIAEEISDFFPASVLVLNFSATISVMFSVSEIKTLNSGDMFYVSIFV